jgi:SAM-dependent methyltransferase
MKYTDHFATQSGNYLQFRPDYPAELFDYLGGLTETHDTAWDCGTGNGQAALALAPYFKHVIATDVNQAQMDVATKKDNISYHAWPAEKTKILSASVDLVTIAQALHWFDFTHFYQEVNRVLKPDGVIAAWCYSLGNVTPAVDKIVEHLYSNILGDTYWPNERRYIDAHYRTIPFPFVKLFPPQFYIEKKLDFSQFFGYLSTWSAIKEYQKRNDKNPLEIVIDDLQNAWGELNTTHMMRWPIHLLVGKMST